MNYKKAIRLITDTLSTKFKYCSGISKQVLSIVYKTQIEERSKALGYVLNNYRLIAITGDDDENIGIDDEGFDSIARRIGKNVYRIFHDAVNKNVTVDEMGKIVFDMLDSMSESERIVALGLVLESKYVPYIQIPPELSKSFVKPEELPSFYKGRTEEPDMKMIALIHTILLRRRFKNESLINLWSLMRQGDTDEEMFWRFCNILAAVESIKKEHPLSSFARMAMGDGVMIVGEMTIDLDDLFRRP